MIDKRTLFHALAVSWNLLAMSTAAAASVQYSVSEVPGGALAITDSGYILIGNALQHPDGTVSSPPVDGQWIEGWAVNSGGTVVGTVVGTVSGSPPGVWQGSSVDALPMLPIGADVLGEADGINDSGVIVGWNAAGQVMTGTTISQPRQLRAVRWTNGVAEDLSTRLPTGGNVSFAKAINNNGQIVIDSNPQAVVASGPNSLSYVLDGNTLTPITANDGTAIGVSGWAINNNGVVAGTISLADGTYHAFLWANGTMRIAPSAASPTPGFDGAMAINDDNIVVGDSRTNQANGLLFPFIWDGANAPVNLNDLIDPASGWELTSAWGINDSGDIVGNGLLNGVPTGYLLTPTASPAIPTPEPATLSVLTLAALPLLRRRR